jgi:EAL domain-containing protein (putative c-di-GMP-specific phosphodiesterase class I)
MLDDDVFFLELQSQMLRSMGYGTVHTAASGAAALALLLAQGVGVDLIFCDLNMPEMDGVEFLQNLSASAYRASVILLSGEGVRIMHTVQKLLSGSGLVILGALEKPVGRAALGALLDRWMPFAGTRAAAPALSITQEEVHAANREQQWLLHYQPKVELKTGVFSGVEALVRWNHPRHGLVMPDHFIALAEDCGAIDTLAEWTLREAMRQLACWQGDGLQITTAVNLSAQNLWVPHFAKRVGSFAHEAGVSPEDITLEITESRLMTPSPAPLESLVRLRLLRFGLSIDDFGTGHSSLAQLRDVPFTELKIDRGFVHGARHDQIIRPILAGSIGLAKRMDMQSVAEGVENEDDWRLLRELGCNFTQGYFISRPMPAERLPAWLELWEARRGPLGEA